MERLRFVSHKAKTVCLPIMERTFTGTTELAKRAVLRKSLKDAAKVAVSAEIQSDEIAVDLVDNIIPGEE